MRVSASFKPASLSYSQLFELAADARYPHSSQAVASWIIRESLTIALLGGLFCTIVGFVGSSTVSPIRLALLVIPLLIFASAAYFFARLRSTYRSNQAADAIVVELSDDGVSVRDRDSEWRTRWKPSFQIVVATRLILIVCGKTRKVYIPRQSFASREAEDEFVRVGRVLQAVATGTATNETVSAKHETAEL
jgi:hypothetical protein